MDIMGTEQDAQTVLAPLHEHTSMSRRLFFIQGLTLGLTLTSQSLLAHGPASHAQKPLIREQQPWGVAGDATEVQREIPIRMTDAMRFEPDRVEIRLGETIRFVHNNTGKVMHEMVIGTQAALAEHAEMMLKFPGMEHDDPWMAHVEPGGTGEIIWTFNRIGEFEFACLIPGHFQAGMVGKLIVR